MNDFGHVLVVDDNRMNRIKLSRGVEQHGHTVALAENGKQALEMLGNDRFDLVLLDIIMPEMDGYEVLKLVGDDDHLRNIPIIVVSALEDMDDVVKAIKLGAVDFLPKNFDAVLLEARINSCLEKKRHRDKDIKTLGEVRRLTDAATELDSDHFNPLQSGIQDIAMRSDALGQLALVLMNKSIEVYNRQLIQKQQIKTLVGCFTLLLVGAMLGLNIVITKLSVPSGVNPLGLSLYTLGIGAVITIFYALLKRVRWPSLSWHSAGYYITWALFSPLLPQLLLFWVASKLSAVLLAVIMTMEAFIVFFIAAFIGLEKLNLRRFFGLGLGAGCILLILIPAIEADSGVEDGLLWLLAAICIPACYAIRNIIIASGKEMHVDSVAATAIVYSIATLFMFTITITTDSVIPFQYPFRHIEWFMIVFGSIEAVAVILFVKLIQNTGGVFASQKAYTVAIAGIIWSVFLLDETVTISNIAALSAAIVGLYFVAQKAKREELLKPYINPPNPPVPGPSQ